MENFSVLMSIYIKEKPEYARACFESLLSQSVPASEWLIVEDGPLTQELYDLLDEYEKKHPGLIKRVPLKENQGLGAALRAGIPECSFDLIARMDTDDIARKDRFEKQLSAFSNDPDLSICGSQIDEFETTPDQIVSKRSVPLTHEEIAKYQKRRDGFNHMTVMYKKQAVLQAGNYEPCPLMEDTYLWVRMIQSGARCMNLPESLVYARIGHAMYERRGGWSYFKKYKEGRKMVRKTGFIGAWDYFVTVFIQFVVALIPGKLRGFIFKKILHR
jgi:glycosyltransferase involved in cell wall biosynthesis